MLEHRPFKGTLEYFYSLKNPTPLHVLVCQSMACTRREKELHRTVKWSRDWWLVVVVGWIEGGLLSVTSSDPNTINNDRLFWTPHFMFSWNIQQNATKETHIGCYSRFKSWKVEIIQNMNVSKLSHIMLCARYNKIHCYGEAVKKKIL